LGRGRRMERVKGYKKSILIKDYKFDDMMYLGIMYEFNEIYSEEMEI